MNWTPAMQPQAFEPNLPGQEDEMLRRFADSMQMNFERWKEGTGYDLEALKCLSPQNQRRMEDQMTPPAGWRDVEALAALDTPTARETLRAAVHAHAIEVSVAVHVPCAGTVGRRHTSVWSPS